MASEAPVAIPCVDWNTISEEILCPLCDYNLRGLIQPRCPECGYRFEWRGLLDPKYRLHPYLFEHHPERNVRSFLRTALGGWRPREFWQRLQPAHRLRPKRLILYWFIVACVSALLPVVAVFGAACITRIQINTAQRNRILTLMKASGNQEALKTIKRRYGSKQAYLDLVLPINPVVIAMSVASQKGIITDIGVPAALLVLWPWATLAALMIFRASMRRAKTKWIHVLRCTVYSSDVMLWMAAVSVLASLAISLVFGSGMLIRGVVFPLILAILILSYFAIMCYRLMIAYRSYLQFDHPRLTIAAAQVVALLLIGNLIMIPILWGAD